MVAIRRGRHDPWWDLEGADAKRVRVRRKFVGSLAFSVAIVACGLTAAAWVQTIIPLLQNAGLG